MRDTTVEKTDQPVVGMVHLPPLPGAANYDGGPVADLCARAVREAQVLEAAGFGWLLLQNTHDAPTRETIPAAGLAAMASIGRAVRDEFPGHLGVNVHKNDGPGALAVAHAIGASFVRVKVLVGLWVGPEGLLAGNAAAVADLRRHLGADIEIWADLGELTSLPTAPIGRDVLADWAERFGGADRLIVTENSIEASVAAVLEARSGSRLPVLIGGRTSADNVEQALANSDGVIVGSCLRTGGSTEGDLDPAQAERYMRAAAADPTAA